MRISKEGVVIGVVGLADLGATVLWIKQHGAAEANPVFAHYLAMGFGWFIAMKVLCLAAPIFLLEWARIRRPRFTLIASRFAICAYICMYCIGFMRLNGALFAEPAAEASITSKSATRLQFIISEAWLRRHPMVRGKQMPRVRVPHPPADVAV